MDMNLWLIMADWMESTTDLMVCLSVGTALSLIVNLYLLLKTRGLRIRLEAIEKERSSEYHPD